VACACGTPIAGHNGMDEEEHRAAAPPLIARRCPVCGTLMTPVRPDPRGGIPERLHLPGPLGGEAIRLRCENGHLSVFRVRDLSG
jgi:hypothetical protein